MKKITYNYDDVKQAVDFLGKMSVQGIENLRLLTAVVNFLDFNGEVKEEPDESSEGGNANGDTSTDN